MAIFTNNDPTYDITAIGFDKNLIKGGASADTPEMASEFLNGLNRSLLGSQSLGSDISLGHQTIAVLPSDNIQEVINTLNGKNGGTLKLGAYTYNIDYNIELSSNITFVGEGKDVTILDFGGSSNNLSSVGSSGSINKNFSINNLTVQNSASASGIDVDYSDFFNIDNVRVTGCSQRGIRVDRSQGFKLSNCRSDNNTLSGFTFLATNTRNTQNFLISNCTSDSNSAIGFSILATSGIRFYTFDNCISDSNTSDGFDIDTTVANINLAGTFIGCLSLSNGGIGFDIGDISSLTFIGGGASLNTSNGVRIDAALVKFIGFANDTNTGVDWNITTNAANLNFIGSGISPDITSLASSRFSETDKLIYSVANIGSSIRTEKKIFNMMNRSGGALVLGDVVVLTFSTADGESIGTTTTQGNDFVFGMVLESISNNRSGQILVEGYTESLKVNGTTDIAVGDLLGTFTTAKIAMKASAGDMCFAIALEAYTGNDSNGVINALIITPRSI